MPPLRPAVNGLCGIPRWGPRGKPMTKKNTNSALALIGQKIKTLEKNNISNVVEIGRLLDEASNQCEHGEYMAWLDREFDWSYRTSVNYRNAYEFAQTCNGFTFESLNLSLTALYLVAGMNGDDEQAAREAIIEAARQRRVTRSIALEIIARLKPPIESVPPDEPDESPAPDEAGGDEALLPDDDETAPPGSGGGPPSELIRALDCVLRCSERTEVWPKVIEAIGSAKFRKIIETLKAAYDEHNKNSSVKSAADRAEAKATRGQAH
jgi:hypothetical protein